MESKMIMMRFKWMTICCLLFLACNTAAQPAFVNRLQEGHPQHIVVYGTSLSSGANGRAWMGVVSSHLNATYGELVKYTLAGKGGMWSAWGVKNLEDSVIAKKPDVVFMEFGINDAFSDFDTPVEVARLNLEYMIDRIKLYSDSCDIILQVMNMPIGKSAALRPQLEEYYHMYREVAEEKQLLLIDHYENWAAILTQGEDEFRKHVPDGIHPNTRANAEIVAPYIIQRIEERNDE